MTTRPSMRCSDSLMSLGIRLPDTVMRKSSFIILLATAVYQCLAAEPGTSPMLQQAYDRLRSVNAFAFGDVQAYGNVVCTTSPGEQCFRTLAESTNGLPLFRSTLTNGTVAARLYALCGIRRLAPEQFDTLAEPITRTNSRVGVRVGSIGMVMMSSNIVAQIRRGAYDDFYPPYRQSQ